MATANEVSADLHSVMDDVANSILQNGGPVSFGSGPQPENTYMVMLEHFTKHGTAGDGHNKKVRVIADFVKKVLA